MVKKLCILLFLILCNTCLFAQVKVVFEIKNIPVCKPGGSPLYLAGNFNNWNAASYKWQMGQNRIALLLPIDMLPGKYSFKVTRGNWETVECSSNGADVPNREISIVHDTTIEINIAGWKDNFPAQEKKHTASDNVHIISEKFDIPQLDRQRRIWIYLPADYAASHKKYPVIYMHDGQNLFDEYTSGYGEWGIDEILDKLPDNKQSIVVGIDHGGDYRITEYDPYDSKYGKGRGEDYVDFLVNTLKPYIDKNYRTKKDVSHTSIAGSSMGGLISMYAILKYPKVFGNAGVFSPAFWIAPNIYDYAQKQKLAAKSRIYFVCGDIEDKTMVADMKKMVEILQAKGIDEANIPTVIMQGEKHNEKQWNKDFPAFYSWLIRGY